MPRRRPLPPGRGGVAAGKKVFNVVLNEKHTIVRDLDIYGRVGYAESYAESYH